jgi:hypothetical protein
VKVEINTKEKSVYVSANDVVKELNTVDQWIKAMQVSRAWLKKELARK